MLAGINNLLRDSQDVSAFSLRRRFIYYLKKWSVICTICAAPSFVIALSPELVLNYSNLEHIAGMILGVGTWIVLYTLLCCHPVYRKIRLKPLLHSSLEWAYLIKIYLALLSFPIALIGMDEINSYGGWGAMSLILVMPDFMAGVIAGILYSVMFGRVMSHSGMLINDFLTTYSMTILEGLVLSVACAIVGGVICMIGKIGQKFRT